MLPAAIKYWLAIVLMMAVVVPTMAEEKPLLAPHQTVSDATKNMIAVIQGAKEYYKDEPERFYSQVDAVIEPLIDFRSFARSVMGKYGSKRYYSSLSDAEKTIYRKEFGRFVDTFKQGLIKTYGKGLLAFNGQKIELKEPTVADVAAANAGGTVDVIQYFYGSAEKPYIINYKMRYNKKDKKWLLRNVTIESINVGKVYRGQFENSMQKYKGDLAAVVDNWTVKASGFDDEPLLDKAAEEPDDEFGAESAL